MISIENIKKYFDNTMVLNGINLNVFKGESLVVIGGSGTGKSVLLKIILGLIEPDEGKIIIDGQNMLDVGRANFLKRFGMLFQGGALYDYMTVEENIMFPLTMFTEKTEDEKLERVNFCLKRVNLEGKNHLMPSELSGGMKKRVSIARAIVMEPKYLLCDEPNSGLDPKTSILIDNLIQEITKEYNITTIVNTHDMNSVMEIGEHIAYINQGEIWWTGSKEDLIRSDNKELNDFVFASELFKRIKNV